SGIPANPLHSQRVLAYDVAVGAGGCVDDVEFYAYLCRVADWRLDWESEDNPGRSQVDAEAYLPSEGTLAFYDDEEQPNKALIHATSVYRSSELPQYDCEGNATTPGGGVLPQKVMDAIRPSLIVSQTRSERRVSALPNSWESP
ncbi:DUF3274 domain-containing protein, partial [Achromobacter sp. NPDC058515]|uniref:effector protein Tle3 domain-containing protein n=1 Tax=Achromobacter sp. NPDC058515 TaxID=3346533 RepID=UPI003660683B